MPATIAASAFRYRPKMQPKIGSNLTLRPGNQLEFYGTPFKDATSLGDSRFYGLPAKTTFGMGRLPRAPSHLAAIPPRFIPQPNPQEIPASKTSPRLCAYSDRSQFHPVATRHHSSLKRGCPFAWRDLWRGVCPVIPGRMVHGIGVEHLHQTVNVRNRCGNIFPTQKVDIC